MLVAVLGCQAPKAAPAEETVQMHDWDAAEAVAKAWLTDQGRAPGAVEHRWERLPHAMAVYVEASTSELVVVHDSAVVSDKGLDALCGWLLGSGFLDRGDATPDDLLAMLGHFEAWRPADKSTWANGRRYEQFPGSAQNPTLSFADGAASLVLHYPDDSPPELILDGIPGAPADAGYSSSLLKATLRIAPDGCGWSTEAVVVEGG